MFPVNMCNTNQLGKGNIALIKEEHESLCFRIKGIEQEVLEYLNNQKMDNREEIQSAPFETKYIL